MVILASQYENSFDFGLMGCQELIILWSSPTVQRWRYFCCHNCNSKFATMLFGKCGRYDLCSSECMIFLEYIFEFLNWKFTYQWSRGYRGTQRVQNKVQSTVLQHPKSPKIIEVCNNVIWKVTYLAATKCHFWSNFSKFWIENAYSSGSEVIGGPKRSKRRSKTRS